MTLPKFSAVWSRSNHDEERKSETSELEKSSPAQIRDRLQQPGGAGEDPHETDSHGEVPLIRRPSLVGPDQTGLPHPEGCSHRPHSRHPVHDRGRQTAVHFQAELTGG